MITPEEERHAWDNYFTAYISGIIMLQNDRRVADVSMDKAKEFADHCLRVRRIRWCEDEKQPLGPIPITPAGLKEGDRFTLTMTLIRPLDHGEKVTDPDGTVHTLINLRGNLWWAQAGDCTVKVLVCTDDIKPSDIVHKSADGIRDLRSNVNPIADAPPPIDIVCCECGAFAKSHEELKSKHLKRCSQSRK